MGEVVDLLPEEPEMSAEDLSALGGTVLDLLDAWGVSEKDVIVLLADLLCFSGNYYGMKKKLMLKMIGGAYTNYEHLNDGDS